MSGLLSGGSGGGLLSGDSAGGLLSGGSGGGLLSGGSMGGMLAGGGSQGLAGKVRCALTMLSLPNIPNLFVCLSSLDSVCNQDVVTLGAVLRGLLVFLSCLLAVVLQVLQTFLRQNLGGLGMVLGDLIDKIEEGLSPVLVGLGIGLDQTLG